MFRVTSAAAESAANSDTRFLLETIAAIGVNQFERGRALPVDAVVVGICVDARCRIEQVVEIHHDAEAWHRAQITVDGPGVARIVYHIWVHAVVHDVRAPTRGPTGWWHAIGLVDVVAREQKRVRVRVAR